MARREQDVTVTAGTKETNRDYGKTFFLREMSAVDAEEWAGRMLLALTRAGVDVPAELMGGGMAAAAAAKQLIAQLLVNGIGSLDYEEIKPLLQQMMDCVQIREDKALRTLTSDDIEEVATRIFLRGEVLELHMGFSLDAGKPASSPNQKPPAQ